MFGIDFSQLTTGHGLALALGMLALMALQWAARWIDGKGAEFVKQELEKLRAKMNENSLLSQIAADDAVIDIIEKAVPEALHEVSDDVQQAVAAGNVKAIPWKDIAARVWAKAKPQVEGGAHDYLKSSSFKDATAIAEVVIRRFVAKRALAQKGVVVDPPRADGTVPAEPVP